MESASSQSNLMKFTVLLGRHVRNELSTGIRYYSASHVPVYNNNSSRIEMVDVDANLTHIDLRKDADVIIQRSLSIGISKLIVPGSTLEESRSAILLAERHPGVSTDLYSCIQRVHIVNQ